MRRLFAVLALAASLTTSAQAQRAWQTEIGLQGGYARIKPAGSGQNDYIDVFGVPGANYVLGLLSHGSVYAIIPWSNKLAVEPSFVLSQLNGGGTITTARLGLRGNYALTPKAYAGAGAVLLYVESPGQQVKQLGLQAVLGYRLHLTGSLNGRVEANMATTKGTDDLGPYIVYGALFGVSTRLRGAATPAGRRGPASARAWRPVLGVAGGYISAHEVGGANDISGVSLPGLGGSLSGISATSFLAGPPTLFVILPIGTKTAIEPGFDIVRVQQGSSATTGFSGNLSARLNYAVTGGWYAAAGGNLNYLKYTGADAATVTGMNFAWGYRFPLTGSWGGRVELNYSLFGKNADLGLAPQNVVGLMFGATMPLK